MRAANLRHLFPFRGKHRLANSKWLPMSGGGSAVWLSDGTFYDRHADWLGSSRFASTSSRMMYYDVAYAPFSETYAEAGTTDRNFTGMNQER
jgi:hypothetical protein